MEELSTAIQKVIEQLGTRKPSSASDILQQWVKIVGRSCARHCQPVDVRGGALIVNVDSSAWMYMLRLKKPKILKQVSQINTKITNLNLRIGNIAY